MLSVELQCSEFPRYQSGSSEADTVVTEYVVHDERLSGHL